MAMIRQAFWEESISHTQMFKWHARFRVGRASIEDDQHTQVGPSAPQRYTMAKLQQLVREDRRQTIQDFADEMELVIGHANGF
jgi:hypothetical protein